MLGLVGITYGILSLGAVDSDGSMLGINEFKQMWVIKDGLKRTKRLLS